MEGREAQIASLRISPRRLTFNFVIAFNHVLHSANPFKKKKHVITMLFFFFVFFWPI